MTMMTRSWPKLSLLLTTRDPEELPKAKETFGLRAVVSVVLVTVEVSKLSTMRWWWVKEGHGSVRRVSTSIWCLRSSKTKPPNTQRFAQMHG